LILDGFKKKYPILVAAAETLDDLDGVVGATIIDEYETGIECG
jgi:hypothetical protein